MSRRRTGSERRRARQCGLLLGLAIVCPGGARAEVDSPPAARFEESATELGIDFRHRHFGSGEKYMPENMAPGVALLDYDGDGRLDVYLVQGSPIGPDRVSPDPRVTNRLYRQGSDGRFEDVTTRAGVGDTGYGMGASWGDYDGDGWLDLYVTNFGANVLYRNRGDGSFEDLTATAGGGDPSWSVSSGFFDPDGDGDLDLWVVNYVDFAFDNHKWCGNAQAGVRAYCHPDVYDGLPDRFYRNDGGRLVDASRDAGVVASAADKGLGVAFADFDGDGDSDVYVANDSTMNYLYLSDGQGSFRESALLAGVGFNGAGGAEASMGVEIGDLDGDGRDELLVSHLDQETNTLYRGLGGGLWADVTEAAGLASPSLPWVGFGVALVDHDLDGDLDLFVANGHIIDNIERFDPSRSHRQPAQLFDNRGDGTFVEVSTRLGLAEPLVGRGVAAGDLDGDLAPDLVVAQNGDRALALLARPPAGAGALAVALRGRAGNPLGFGARLELATAGGRLQTSPVLASRSYASQGSADVCFGLGSSATADRLTVRWPGGRRSRYAGLPAGHRVVIPEALPASAAARR